MFLFVLTLHFILCAVLVSLVLIQQGKGADMGAAFGAGGSNSLFGAGGATSLIVKVTTATAVAFMITSITLINLSGSESGLASISASTGQQPSLAGSVMEGVAAPAEANPAEPSTASTSANTTPASEANAASEASPVAANPVNEAPKVAPSANLVAPNVVAEVNQVKK